MKGKKKQTTTTIKRIPRSSSPPNTKRWYYAVARGKNPGVYTDWPRAEEQVNGFSGSMHKKFKKRREAERFVEANRRLETESEEESDASEEDSETTLEVERKPRESTKRSTKGKPTHKSAAPTRTRGADTDDPGFPPLALCTPDPSIGNSKEFFKIALADDKSMCEKMSPPGLDLKTMQELANATLDAVQLPGTSGTDATENTTADLIGALNEMAEDKRTDWTEDRPRRDVQWKASNRTSLLTVKSETALQERHGSFQGLPEEVYESQVHLFSSILGRLHWSPGMVQAWSQSNWFLRLGKDTLDNYMALHLHLVSLNNAEGWEYARESLKYHGDKLADIRKITTCRLTCLVKIYIFLREA
jgi:hypothetical protein